ncbi:unnamed protein product, partial [Choristocarpus tenellus]
MQDCNYPPDRGLMSEVGRGLGEHLTVNVPLPPGCGGGAYSAAMKRVVCPAVDAFRPDLVRI